MPRRAGSPTAFWNNAAVGVNGASSAILMARDFQQISIYVTSSAATTITVEAAHHGALTPEGNEPDASTPPATFGTLFYMNDATPVRLVLAGAGTQALIVPDFAPAWIRLRSSAAATITAGFELAGD
jgi:hypothetical protein